MERKKVDPWCDGERRERIMNQSVYIIQVLKGIHGVVWYGGIYTWGLFEHIWVGQWVGGGLTNYRWPCGFHSSLRFLVL